MVEVKMGPKTLDKPLTVYVYGVTEEDFHEMADEETKAELLDGVMIVHSYPSPRHNRIDRFVRGVIQGYAEEKELGQVFGPLDLVHLATCRCFAPDGFFLEKDRVPDPLPDEMFEGPPDLVMEVLSPTTRNYDLTGKRPAFRQAGVQELWFIDFEQERVIVDRRRRRGYVTNQLTEGRLTTPLLPGFWLDLAWLWAQPLPPVQKCLRQILQDRPPRNSGGHK